VLAESAAPGVLYELIRTLNRSPPHQKILKFALMTLRNAARHGPKFAKLIAAPQDAAVVYLELLQVSIISSTSTTRTYMPQVYV
jgi:hypothetical protein